MRGRAPSGTPSGRTFSRGSFGAVSEQFRCSFGAVILSGTQLLGLISHVAQLSHQLAFCCCFDELLLFKQEKTEWFSVVFRCVLHLNEIVVLGDDFNDSIPAQWRFEPKRESCLLPAFHVCYFPKFCELVLNWETVPMTQLDLNWR